MNQIHASQIRHERPALPLPPPHLMTINEMVNRRFVRAIPEAVGDSDFGSVIGCSSDNKPNRLIQDMCFKPSTQFIDAYITAMATEDKYLVIGHSNGEALLLSVDKLNFKMRVNLSDNCINEIRVIDGRFVFFSDKQIIITRINSLEILFQMDCENKIKGLIKINQINYVVDSEGYLKPILFEEPRRPVNNEAIRVRPNLGPISYITQIREEADQALYPNPIYDLVFVQFNHMYAIVQFNGVGNPSILQKFNFCRPSDYRITLKLYNECIYYTKYSQTTRRHSDTVFIKIIHNLTNETRRTHKVKMDDKHISFFEVQNSKIICVTEEAIIGIFSTELETLCYIILDHPIHSLLFIKNHLFFCMNDSEIVSKEIKIIKHNKQICANCFIFAPRHESHKTLIICKHFIPTLQTNVQQKNSNYMYFRQLLN